MKRLRVLFLAVVLCALVSGISVKAQAAVIHKGIYIDNTDVSGMTPDEVRSMVESKVADRYDACLTFTSPTGFEVKVHPAELGMTWSNTDIAKQAASYGTQGNILQRYKIAKDLQRNNVRYNIDQVL